jgi:glycine/D-amino acid oxidase-like deaminating enzyme
MTVALRRGMMKLLLLPRWRHRRISPRRVFHSIPLASYLPPASSFAIAPKEAVGNCLMRPFPSIRSKVVLLIDAGELDDVSRGRILSAGIAVIPTDAPSYYEIGSSYIRDFTDASPDEGGARWLMDQLGALGILDRDELHKRIRGRRAGIRPASRDRLAYLGPMKSQGPAGCRIFVFNGLGTRGYMLAPALAGMLADHILDGSAIPSELMPDRVAGVS